MASAKQSALGRLVVVDLDRTLFDTARNFDDFMAMLRATHGDKLVRTMSHVETNSEHFDRFAYLNQEHGLDYGQLISDFTAYVNQTYGQDHNYLFPGAAELIAFLAQEPDTFLLIFTTGSEQSQRFKLDLCPGLAGLPHKITRQNKGRILQAEFDVNQAIFHSGRFFDSFVLIDDKADTITHIKPAPNRLLIHLLREGAKYQQLTGRQDVHVIHSLEEAITLLQ